MESQVLEKLIDAARRRDEQAFGALVNAHYGLVYALAYSTTGDWAAAQDIAQDTFVVAWTHLHQLRHAGAFPMWIRKIARNLSLNWIRSADYRRRLTERHAQLGAETSTDPDASPEALDRESRAHALWSAVQELSPPIREALVLFYLEGRSVAQASAQLGITENAFKLRLHTGRAKLRKHYEQQVEDALERDLRKPDTKAAASRILAGLAIGPAMPVLGKGSATTGLALWWHHLVHETLNDSIAVGIKGALVMNAKQVVGIAGVLALCVGGLYFVSQQPAHTTGRHVPRTATSATQSTDHSSSLADDTGSQQVKSASDQYTPPSNVSEPVALASNAQSKLEATGEMTASAALLQSMETGKISDPQKYASISGVVVDTHGAAVPKATVTVFSGSGGEMPSPLESLLAVRQNPAHTMTAFTDPNGHFAVEGIAYEGSATVSANADGFTMKPRGGVHVPVKAGDKIGNVRVTLEPGKGLYGRLLAPDGKPVTDGVVNLVAFRSRAESPNGTLGTANTDKEGNFRFAFSREGTAFLVTSSLKYGGASFDDVEIGSDDIIELKMPAPARLAGTITWTHGGAAPNVLVLLTGSANDGHGQYRVPASIYAARTDDSGAYAIDAIDTNEAYTVTVTLQDKTPLSQPEHLAAFSPGATQTWNYAIQELITVRGHVVGETTGRPLRDIKVAALKDGKPVENSDTPVAEDGSYEMRLTSGPGNYTIYPRLWRIEPTVTGYKYGKPAVLTPDQDAVVDLTFIDTATMSVRVIDAAGKPMSGLMLGIHEDDHTWMPVATTPADGRFTWSGFMPGIESNFVVFDGRNGIGETDPIACEAGQIYAEQTVVVYGSAGIEGVAVKPNGEPLANGVITITASYALMRQVEQRVNTDDTGHFVVTEGLPATGVILEMNGYTESNGAVDRYQFVSDELTLIDKQVQNLGTIRFKLEQSNIDVEP